MRPIVSALLVAAVLVASVKAGSMQRMWHGKQSAEVPYHVHMWVYDETDYSWPGSGVLITSKHVLTAAVNIFHFNRWDLGFGSASQTDLNLVTSYEAFVHEQFDDTTDDNNLGVVVMPTPLEFTALVNPISLPKQGERLPREGQIGTIAAFSYMTDFGPISRDLEFGSQRILSDSACENVYPHLRGIVNHFFCATDMEFNVCGGAQGAGLVITQNRREMLAGIVSFGSIWKGCSHHTPPGFIKVSEYVDWIMEKTQ